MQALPTPGTLVAEKYRIEALLGEGGMGAVFRANHELMDKPVALKWLHPELTEHAEAKARFIREARAAARIRHPNVVDVYDVGTHGDALFLVMELLEGESFEALLGRGETPLSDALGLLIGAMHGVAAAHQRGIVHRDIKPENIFVERDDAHPAGIAKVLDFGISKLADDRTGGRNVTQTGHTMGTPTYMSLEQINGARDIDHRTDVYAFGVLLYRTLTGELPFDGPTFGAIAVQVATHTPPPPSHLRPALPAAIDAVVMRAMARDRSHRFDSMRALSDALTAIGIESGLLTSQAVQLAALTPNTPSLAARLDPPRTPTPLPPSGPTLPAEPTPDTALEVPREATHTAALPAPPAQTPVPAPPPPRAPTPPDAMQVPRAPAPPDSAAVPTTAAATLPVRRPARRAPLLAVGIAVAVLGIGSLGFGALRGAPAPEARAPLRVAAPPPRLPTMLPDPPPLAGAPTTVMPAPDRAPASGELAPQPAEAPATAPHEATSADTSEAYGPDAEAREARAPDAAVYGQAPPDAAAKTAPRARARSPIAAERTTESAPRTAAGRRSGRLRLEELTQ